MLAPRAGRRARRRGWSKGRGTACGRWGRAARRFLDPGAGRMRRTSSGGTAGRRGRRMLSSAGRRVNEARDWPLAAGVSSTQRMVDGRRSPQWPPERKQRRASARRCFVSSAEVRRDPWSRWLLPPPDSASAPARAGHLFPPDGSFHSAVECCSGSMRAAPRRFASRVPRNRDRSPIRPGHRGGIALTLHRKDAAVRSVGP